MSNDDWSSGSEEGTAYSPGSITMVFGLNTACIEFHGGQSNLGRVLLSRLVGDRNGHRSRYWGWMGTSLSDWYRLYLGGFTYLHGLRS